MYWVHKHEVSLAYGGPEEGGWWYDTGAPVSEWVPPKFDEEEAAYARARELNQAEEKRRELEEEYGYSSVLSYRSNHFAYSVAETPVMVSYPSERPHYE